MIEPYPHLQEGIIDITPGERSAPELANTIIAENEQSLNVFNEKSIR